MAGMNDIEWASRLASVINRHKHINVKPMVHHEDLGLDVHEKKKIENEIDKGHDNAHENFAKTVGEKGSDSVKALHKVASNLNHPGYKEFAEDLATEFHF